MRIMIDAPQSVVTEFGYKSIHPGNEGAVEYVQLSPQNHLVSMKYINDDNMNLSMHQVYVEDIPNHIRALQAAYDEMSARKLRNGVYDNA